MLTPELSTAALKHYFTNTDLWNNRRGFGDAFNLEFPDGMGPWYNRATFGIDNGPLLMGIDAARSQFTWETISEHE